MNINGVVSAIKQMFNGTKKVSQSLPSLLLFCTTMRRPGMSAMDTAATVIQDYGKIGIPTGTNADGTPNMINAYTYLLIKDIYKDIKQNGVGEGVMSPGTIQFTGTGGNAGGPVVVQGFNTNWPRIKIRFN